MDKKEIGIRIKQARLDLGWKQTYVAGRIGIHQSTYSRMEKGEHLPNAKEFASIAEIYLKTIEYLQNGTLPVVEVNDNTNGLGPQVTNINGHARNGLNHATDDVDFYKDQLKHKDKQLEEAQGMMSSLIDLLSGYFRGGGGGGG